VEKRQDYVAIEDLVKKYCLFFDTNQPERIIELFTEDVLIDYGPDVVPIEGKAAALAMISNGLNFLFAQTSHHLSNFILAFDSPKSAHSTSYVYAWHRYQNKSEIGYLWGHYHHKFECDSGIWKISELKLFAVHTEDFHRERMHPVARR